MSDDLTGAQMGEVYSGTRAGDLRVVSRVMQSPYPELIVLQSLFQPIRSVEVDKNGRPKRTGGHH